MSENIDGQEVKVRHLVFTVSNFLSFSRIPAASLIIYWHSEMHNPWSWGILSMIAYIVFSDYMDGFMARWLNQVSELGKSIDPLSDKLSAFMLFVYMVVNGWIPLWFLWFFMVRDGFILIGSLFLKLKYGKVAMSVMSGKIAVNVLALYWLTVFFYPQETLIHHYTLIATMVIMVYSFFDYMFRYFKIMQGARFN
ncbi:CDP-alcohol phosphatidyltransferase family protein [bacterium]|nr:MAG: CDP-alcohol phosphatidyltransferase family protein [bacterium]